MTGRLIKRIAGILVLRRNLIAGIMLALTVACAVLIPTLCKSAFPAIAKYCSTVNACAVATVIPLIITPIVSAFTKKPDPEFIARIFSD